ncbi:MAG: amino acid-binding protein [Betaproteobacteria bacterium]|nr:amino acid-binding protein [Betaproteobacteria bacterium]MBI2960338.1 amino acid-binding protein [Betaproteobacteria bacterium]
MKLKLNRVDLWTATVEDRAGGLAEKLEPLAQAGANFEFVFARRTPEQPGKGIVFVFPVKGAKAAKAARDAGLGKSEEVHSVRVEGQDRPAVTARIARALADAGLSFRALSASALGRNFVAYLALDNAADASKALSVLKKLA